jgi:hypothetical protein
MRFSHRQSFALKFTPADCAQDDASTFVLAGLAAKGSAINQPVAGTRVLDLTCAMFDLFPVKD